MQTGQENPRIARVSKRKKGGKAMPKPVKTAGCQGIRLRMIAGADRYDPNTGEKLSRELLGVSFVDTAGQPEDPPKKVVVPTSWIEEHSTDSWLTVENARVVVRPGGPAHDPWQISPEKGIPHMFKHIDSFTINTVDGPAKYAVVHQPDKYHDGPAGTDVAGDPNARVDNFYLAELKEG